MIPAGQARVDKLIRDIQSMGQVEQIRIITTPTDSEPLPTTTAYRKNAPRQ